MRDIIVTLFGAVLLLLSHALAAEVRCDSDSECRPTECCSKVPFMMVVGKRQDHFVTSEVFTPMPMYRSTTCKPYLGVNATCANLYRQNGDCGCAPDMYCKYYPELDPWFQHMFGPGPGLVTMPPTFPPASRRRALPGNPDAHKCTKRH